MLRNTRYGIVYRLLTGLAGVVLLLAPATATAQSPTVELNAYCQDHGSTGHLANGRTAYCVQVQRTDAFVWSYSRTGMAHDPNARGYTCDANSCRWPDGSNVPNYRRCGILCGEPPTSGDIQSGLYDCFQAGTDFMECESRIR